MVRLLELGRKKLARPTLVIVTGSDLQADQASGAPDDCSVAGFELNGIVYLIGSSVGTHREVAAELLRHELAHAYTESACAGDHPPAALVEGLGVVGEDNLDFADLRGELACGNQTLPLKKALTFELGWQGLNDDQIGLGYLEGASLVLFIDKYWGMARLYSLIDKLQCGPATGRGHGRGGVRGGAGDHVEPAVREVAAVRADAPLIARRRTSLGVADVVLAIAWAVARDLERRNATPARSTPTSVWLRGCRWPTAPTPRRDVSKHQSRI